MGARQTRRRRAEVVYRVVTVRGGLVEAILFL